MVNFHVPKPERLLSLKNVNFNLLSFKSCPYDNNTWPISLVDLNIILGAWNGFSGKRRKCTKIFENTAFDHVTKVLLKANIKFFCSCTILIYCFYLLHIFYPRLCYVTRICHSMLNLSIFLRSTYCRKLSYHTLLAFQSHNPR